MFCKNCGGELAEGTKFCKYCGTALNSGSAAQQSSQATNQTSNTNSNPYVYNNVQMNQPASVPYGGNAGAQTKKLILMLVMAAITIFLALGGLWKTLVSEGYWRSEAVSLMEVFDMLEIEELFEAIGEGYGDMVLEALFSTEMGLYMLVFFLAGIFSVVSLISGVIFVFKLIGGSSGTGLARSARSVGRWQLVSMILLIAFMLLMKLEYGVLGVKFSFWGWAVLILPLVNSFGICNAYERACLAAAPDAYKMKERVCAQCNTYYSVGNRCPRCGSQSIR